MTTFSADVELGLDLYSRIASGGPGEFLLTFTIPGPPPSKVRARFSRSGHAYKTAADVDAERRTAWFMAQNASRPYRGNVALGCVFFRPNRQRIDTDNMMKHVCDAANGVLWVDDSQVTAIMGITEFDPVEPRTVIVVGHHMTGLTRGTDDVVTCAICSKVTPRTVRGYARLTCSRECSARARGFTLLDEPVICPVCEQPFKRTTTAQTMCSPACRQTSRRDQARRKAVPFSRCCDCDVELAHHRGGRCRDCWRVAVAKASTRV